MLIQKRKNLRLY